MPPELKVQSPAIVPEKITKPIQLLAVWLAGLVILEVTFLTAASQLGTQPWLSTMLVIAAIAFVPLFLILIFVLQTKFRAELQEDQFYSRYIQARHEHQEEDLRVAVESRIKIEKRFGALESALQEFRGSKMQTEEKTTSKELAARANSIQLQYYTLLHDISHALRTSIHGISAAAERLSYEINKASANPHKVQTIINDILEATSSQSVLLETIRFQSPSEIAPGLNRASSSLLPDVVRPVVRMLMQVAKQKTIEISTSTEDLPRVNVDVHAFRTALFNVLQNALQYAKASTVVTVRLSCEEQMARVAVTNKGLPIAPDELDHLAKLGYRANSAIKHAPSGVGLGLYATSQIMKLHGGFLKLSSTPDGITTATLAFPME